jgi:hypothetical protein
MALEHFWLDKGVRPEGIEQFIMGYQPSRVFNQISQNTKSPGRHRDAFIISAVSVPPEALVHRIQPERRELLHPHPEMPQPITFAPRMIQTTQ